MVLSKILANTNNWFVPYNGPKEVSTPDVSKGDMRYVKKRGMGAALRDDYFYDC